MYLCYNIHKIYPWVLDVEKCDVLVIGGGAAGCTAALKASKSGLKTVLIEKGRPETGRKIDVTQDNKVDGIIRELGLKPAHRSNRSRWLSRNHHFDLESKISDLFWVRGDEDALDMQAERAAADKGCEIIHGGEISSVRLGENGYDEVVVNRKGKELAYKPGFIIAADGWASGARRLAFPHITHTEGPHFSGVGIIAKDLDLEEGVTHIYFDEEHIPGGYVYAANAGGNCFIASALPVHRMGGKTPGYYFRNFMEHAAHGRKIFGKNAKVLGSFHGGSRCVRLNKHAHRNLLVTGDAAGLLDPFLGYGVNHAIFSGYWAAEMCRKFSPLEVADQYNNLVARELMPGIRQGETARRIFDRLSNHDLDRLFSFVHHVSKHTDLDSFFDNPLISPVALGRAMLNRPDSLLLLRHLHQII